MSIENRLAAIEHALNGTHGVIVGVRALEERAGFHEQKFNSIEQRLDNQHDDITALLAQLGELQKAVERLESAVGEAPNSDGKSLATQLSEVKTGINRVDELITTIDAHGQAIARIKRFVGVPVADSAAAGAAAAATPSLSSRMTAVEARTKLLEGNQLQIREGAMFTAQWKTLIEGHSDEISALYQSKATNAQFEGLDKVAAANADAVASLRTRVTAIENTVGSQAVTSDA